MFKKRVSTKTGVRIIATLLCALLFLLIFAQGASAAVMGDVNESGTVNVEDVILVQKHILEIKSLTVAQKALADVNGNGDVTIDDAVLIMRFALGLITEFPHAILKVNTASVINAKTIGVEFNRIPSVAEKADISVTVKNAANATVSTTAAWDGKVARVTRSTGIDYLAGVYTVEVTGVSPAFSGTVTITAPVATSLDIGATNIPDATLKAPLRVKLLDQYGEEMPISDAAFNKTAFNVTTSTNVTGRISFDPTAKFVINTVAVASEFNVGDQVQIGFVHIATGLSKTVTLPVVPMVQLGSITFGDVVLPAGSTNLTRDLVNVRIPFTAKDQYGNDLFLVQGANVNMFSSNISIIANTALSFISIDEKQYVNISNFLNSGSVNVTILGTPGGVVGSKSLNVLQAAGEIETITPEVTALTIGKGSTGVVGLTVKDAFGTTLTPAQYVGKISTVVSSNPVVVANTAALRVNNVVGNANYGKLEIPVLAGATTGASTVITVNSVNGKTATVTVTAGAAPLPSSLEVKATPAPDTTLVVGGSTYIDYVVKDQYGSAMTDITGYQIDYATVSGNNNTIQMTGSASQVNDISGTLARRQITAIATGSDGFRATLKKTVGLETVQSVTTSFTVLALDGTGTFTVDSIPTLHAITNTDAPVTGNSPYDKPIVVRVNGAVIPQSAIQGVSFSGGNATHFRSSAVPVAGTYGGNNFVVGVYRSNNWPAGQNEITTTMNVAVMTTGGLRNASRAITATKEVLDVSELVAFSSPIINQLTPPTGAGAVNPLPAGYTFAAADFANLGTGSGAGYLYAKDQFGVYHVVAASKGGNLNWSANTGHWNVTYNARTAINNPALAQFGTGDVTFTNGPDFFAKATTGYLASANTDVAITIIAGAKSLSTIVKIVDMGPAPDLTSATYNVVTGALIITGTDFATTGVTNDVTKLVVNGVSLTNVSTLVVTNATTLTVTVVGADKTAVNASNGFNTNGVKNDTIAMLEGLQTDAVGNKSAAVVAAGNNITVSGNL